MSTYDNYGYTIVRRAMNELATAIKATAEAFFNYPWFMFRQQTQRLPQRRTIGKEHRGYARRSRQRLVQRKG